MDVELAEQRIILLQERIGADELQQRAMDRRTNAVASGISGLLQRPKADDIVLVGAELRLEPFWHVSGRARYEYTRARTYRVPVQSPEVDAVTMHGVTAPVVATGGMRQFEVAVDEHCAEQQASTLFLSALTGEPVADGAAVIEGPSEVVADPATLSANGAVVLAPEHRSSFAVRTLIAGLSKPLQADAVIEERIVVERVDLCYRPLRAYEFHWTPRDRRGWVVVDALTGQVTAGASLTSGLAKLVTRDSMFDLGADAAGLLIPGGSIAVKVVKIAIDQTNRSS